MSKLEDIQSLTDEFHRVSKLVPPNQILITLPSTATIKQGIQMMQKNGISQIPVVAGEAIVGIFSFRSLAQHLLKIGQSTQNLGDLPVVDFVESFHVMQPTDNWESILDYLSLSDGVLVGTHEHIDGIVTAIDVLTYLQKIASPFIMLAEIELSLRRIIGVCINRDEIAACIQASLASLYKDTPEKMPTKLSEMTFDNYVHVIRDGRNWRKFSIVFGETDWHRKITTSKLEEVRDLRNTVFHFKRNLTVQDYEVLTTHRNWLQLKAKTFDGLKKINHADKALEITIQNSSNQKWDRASVLAKLTQSKRILESNVIEQILDWSEKQKLKIRWSEDENGGFYALLINNHIEHQIFFISIGKKQSYAQVLFEKMMIHDPFRNLSKRRKLLDQLKTIPDVDIPLESIDKSPGIFLSKLNNQVAVNTFLNAFDWAIQEILMQSN